MTDDNDEWAEFNKWVSDVEWMIQEARRFHAINQPERSTTYLRHAAWTINERIKNEDG